MGADKKKGDVFKASVSVRGALIIDYVKPE